MEQQQAEQGKEPIMVERKIIEELDNLREDLGRLRSDFKDLLDETRKAAKARASDAQARIREHVEEGVESLRAGVDHIREYGEKAYRRVHDEIGEKPILTVSIAFGVGLLLGKLLERRDRR